MTRHRAMASLSTLLAVLGMGVVGIGFGASASAQATGPSGTIGTKGTVGTTGTSATGPTLALAPAAVPVKVLSPAEQQSSAQQIVERGNSLSQRITNMLDEARREADVIRVTCLNDKLTQVNANLRAAQARATALVKIVDTDLRNHEFTVISVLGQKLAVLEQEANQCVGQDLYETGATTVTTDKNSAMIPFEPEPNAPNIMPPAVPTTPPPPSATSTGA